MTISKRCIYIDAFSGVSGDMLIGALLDVGAPLDALKTAYRAVSIDVEIGLSEVHRHGIRGKRLEFYLKKGASSPRRLNDFKQSIQASTLPSHIQRQAMAILETLFEAEARAHGVSMEEVHLHELGSYDTLLDVVGALVLIDALGIEAIFTSPIPVSRGLMDSSHGTLPIPPPAVAFLMAGVPAYGIEIDKELVTPTGLAILRHITKSFGPFPEMVVRKVGYGAGERDLLAQPNLVRIWLGELTAQDTSTQATEIITVVDDTSGEIISHAQKTLLANGALDVYITPVIMKKGRPGYEIHVLAPIGQEERLVELLFRETSTIGVRLRRVDRICLPRKASTCKTPWGSVKVKEVDILGEKRIYTEYEDAARVSKDAAVPLIEIYRTVEK